MKQTCSEKLFLQKNIPSNKTNLESYKLQNKKNPCIKLQPLNAKGEITLHNYNERESSYRWNHVSNKIPAKPDQKKLSSKIPVFQRKKLNAYKQNADIKYDAALSAADRRQKFHLSRIGLPAVNLNERVYVVTEEKQHHSQGILAWNTLPKVSVHPLPAAVIQREILPPIKPIDVITVSEQKKSSPKNKSLLGEITHFPALFNPQLMKQKHKQRIISTIPHLPPIFSIPLAPPPSISTSVEQEIKEHEGNRKRNDDWESNIMHGVHGI